MFAPVISVVSSNSHRVAPIMIAFLAHTISNNIVQKSVQSRLVLLESSASQQQHRNAIIKSHTLLQTELQRKTSSFKQAVPLSLLILAIGQIVVWTNRSQSWHRHAPSALVLGVDFAFQCFFNALDNIQDEVASLGKARLADLMILSFGSLGAMIFLMNSNKIYHVKAISILFGTILAKTDDTILWKVYGVVGILLSMALLAFGNATGPSSRTVAALVISGAMTSFSYETLTAKGTKAPEWLVEKAEGGILHHMQLCLLSAIGVYPVSWVLREVAAYLGYFWLKIQQHRRNLHLVSADCASSSRLENIEDVASIEAILYSTKPRRSATATQRKIQI